MTTDRQLVAIVLLVLGGLLVLPFLFAGFGMMGYGPTMGGHMWDGSWSGGVPGWLAVVGFVVPLLFLVALVGLGYLLVRAVTGPTDGTDPAMEELRRAYARGDLTDEEYERRRERLEEP